MAQNLSDDLQEQVEKLLAHSRRQRVWSRQLEGAVERLMRLIEEHRAPRDANQLVMGSIMGDLAVVEPPRADDDGRGGPAVLGPRSRGANEEEEAMFGNHREEN